MGALADPTHLSTLDLASSPRLLPPPPGRKKKPDADAAADDSDSDHPYLHHELPGGSPYLRHLGAVAVDPPVHDPRDAGTADAWVERSPSLTRLTGKHPFNGEPPTSELMRHGFITPAPLHYVRNHGAVPRGDWATWAVEVAGLVRRPARFTMDELVREFRPLELPVTLACSSGRRKEQNMTRQTLGFHWGPGAVSTSLWRGARLRDVLGRCGVERGAKYVCFEGGDDLPGGGGAMDPTMDVMLAYMQNGGPILPDHGFPVRLIVPGYTAGRMVKWLRRIVVTTAESDNYYHHRDNRLFPSHVDAKLAEAEGWWYKPEYVINEMNINSVITTPANGDVLPINATTAESSYTVKGFAFSGAGKKVTRVELTLDGGETWLFCSVNHPERPTKYGKYWCWCFWSVDVEVADLLASKEIAVRAWDQSLNTQPEKLTWNLMVRTFPWRHGRSPFSGMMTNCWFRVKINVCRPRKGEIGMAFEHPVQPGPGNQSGGWMARQKHLDIPDPTATPATTTSKETVVNSNATTSTKKFTMSEVREHASRDSAWIVVHGHVYDCTPYLKDHPGGADSILLNAGTDCTDEFDAIHSDKATSLLSSYLIGDLVDVTSGTGDSPDANTTGDKAITAAAAAAPPVALSNPREKVPCRLVGKKELSRDVRLLRFALPSPDQVLGLPVGKHLFLCATIDGKLCMRAYTPTSSVDERGHFDLLVKVYFKDEHPKFPSGGRMTQHLDALPVGSYVDVKGPLGHVEYAGRGVFLVAGERRKKPVRRLAMVAGGSGITPIYQVIQAVLRDQPEDETVMHLVYANRTEDDILLRDELDRWAAEFPDRLKVWYVISQVRRPETTRWRYSVGTVKEEILREHLPEGDDDTLALACGPPLMIQHAVSPNLEKMKYKSDSVIVF
ncbi:hypothetical protein HU200_062427 [Digitaria exilis]|uniref:Nitrate reductase n=1 Tax=Digitaria exilis TaxID=1010633 RepID=A0A835A6L8_9POAL|nr:hypothetical protein HU200_062427 [Digitaria exilis]